MLRLIFVLSLIAGGAWFALRGPFQALLFYVWNAYFRPESWLEGSQATLIQTLRISYWVGLYVVGASLYTRQRFVFNTHTALIAFFALHCLISTALSNHATFAWDFLTEFLKALTIAYLIAVLASDRIRLRQLILVMALSLGFEGAKQGWAELVRHPGSLNTNPVPFLGDNNGVAVGMLMLVPLFDALARTTSARWPRHLYRFLLIGVLYRAITTYSRGGFLSCGTLALIYWIRSENKVRLLVGMMAVAAIVLPAMPNEFWERMATIHAYEEQSSGDDTSAVSRLHFWKVAADMAAAHPLFGVGFNSFSESYDAFDTSRGEYGTKRSVHSVWFGVLSEVGYLGFLLYLSILWLSFLNCRQTRVLVGSQSDLRTFSTAIETSLSVFVVGGSFLPFQYNEMLWHMIGLTLALKLVAAREQTPHQPSLTSPPAR